MVYILFCLFGLYYIIFGFGMVYKCFRICSNWTQFHIELNLLKVIFHKNSYPENFIGKCFRKVLNNIHLVKENVPTWKKAVASSPFILTNSIFAK